MGDIFLFIKIVFYADLPNPIVVIFPVALNYNVDCKKEARPSSFELMLNDND